jgi:hypothetical protein
MTDYNLIFGAVLVFNVLVTFRASSYWKKYFPGVFVVVPTMTSSSGLELESLDSAGGGRGDDGGGDDETTKPLVGAADGEVFEDEEGGGGGSPPSKPSSSSSSSSPPESSSSSAASDAAADIRHAQLLRKYLFVYLFAAMSDWLQGPYVYALYDAYGYSQHDIAVLFVAGFGSSMVFGSFIGGMADAGGRKKFVILFAMVYASSCMTKREYRGFLLCVFMYIHRQHRQSSSPPPAPPSLDSPEISQPFFFSPRFLFFHLDFCFFI